MSELDITSVELKTHVIDYRDANCSIYGINKPLTCQITNENIESITKFMCYIMTKCPTNIDLNDFKTGNIINRGGFGYTFKLGNDKHIIIKITVCNPMNPEFVESVLNETKLQETITKINKDNFVKLYGYFRRTGDEYEYRSVVNNFANSINCIDKTYDFKKSCEVYLLIEEGKYDLTKFTESITKNNFTKFNELLKFYKISKKTLKDYGIFIHSDIKLENIILSNDDKFKLIDFGLSLFSKTFFTKAKGGTPYIFKLLFTYDNIYNDALCVVSPLFDIFSLILSYFELCLKKRLLLPTYDFDEINRLMMIFANANPEVKNFINSLLSIFNSIYNYHQSKIKKYYEDEKNTGFFKSFTSLLFSPIDTYINSYNIVDFTITDLDDSKKSLLPTYNNTGNKLKDDMEYLIKLINFVLPMNISEGDDDDIQNL
jgi:serine/threonine protein kinase